MASRIVKNSLRRHYNGSKKLSPDIHVVVDLTRLYPSGEILDETRKFSLHHVD